MNKTSDKRALTIREAAEYACVSRGTIENWLTRGVLPFEELPSRGTGKYCFRRIRKTDLDAFLNRFYITPRETTTQNQKHQNRPFLLPRNACYE